MTDPTMRGLLASAAVAFTGVIVRRPGSTVPEVPADDRTAVVEVDGVIKAPPALGLSPGTTMTLRLSADLPVLAAGDRATFFATGWVYAETLALLEVGRLPADDAGGPAVAAGGPALLADIGQEEVLTHARAADAVVRGRVVSLAQAPGSGSPREHDPEVWIAVLAVDLVAKGDIGAADQVTALYANSLDVRWRSALKPKANQAGLWLLHRPPAGWPPVAPFAVLHGIDLQPSLQLDLLRERGLT
jgi:hypothetical protein